MDWAHALRPFGLDAAGSIVQQLTRLDGVGITSFVGNDFSG